MTVSSNSLDPRRCFAEATVSEGRVHWKVDRALRYFDGHFPAMPVLPAVAMLDATTVFAEKLTGERWRLVEVVQAKFVRPVVPGDAVVVELTVAEDGRATARWVSGPEKIAELTIRLEATSTDGSP